MSIKKEQVDTLSGVSSETNTNSKESEAQNIKSLCIKRKKKKVKFKSKFINVIKIESYKKYNGDNNEPKNQQNFKIPKYKEIHCTCSIW